MLKRYTLVTFARLPWMKEMPDGDYVRYKDYEAEQEARLDIIIENSKVLDSVLENIEKLFELKKIKE